jgi:hypothetical protein
MEGIVLGLEGSWINMDWTAIKGKGVCGLVWSGLVCDIFGCGAAMMHQARYGRNSFFNALFAGSNPHDVGCCDPVLCLVSTKPVNV